MKNFVFFNSNPKQRFKKTGEPVYWKGVDCTVRALTAAECVSWKDAYQFLCNTGLEEYKMPHDGGVFKKVCKKLGYSFETFKSSERVPIYEFVKQHPKGTYIVRTRSHVTAVVDGKYYDAYDCGTSYVTSYWKKQK